jgi:hypothetical protein
VYALGLHALTVFDCACTGKLCTQPDPIAVPVLLHRKDAGKQSVLALCVSVWGVHMCCLYVSVFAVRRILTRTHTERIAPLWLKWTEFIRNDTGKGRGGGSGGRGVVLCVCVVLR